jgi:hypothetical protein
MSSMLRYLALFTSLVPAASCIADAADTSQTT